MLKRLLITNFRVLQQVELAALKRCNVFIGKNGSGKTSILETIFLLSRGKSFRHHQPKHYICYGEPQTTVYADFSADTTPSQVAANMSMGVAKTLKGDSKLRLNATNVATQSQLTRELPVILLDPTQLDLLDHGSVERRGLLDWLVFHIEPSFYKTWLSYQRALKQRNRLLREHETFASLSQAHKMQLDAWNQQLAQLGMQIHHMRQAVMELWQPLFKQVCEQFLPQYAHMSMRYSAGFDTELGLLSVLTERQAKDVDLGYTRVGAHRCDVMIFTDNLTVDDKTCGNESITIKSTGKKQAADVFSRGEKKLLIMALKLSQLQLLYQKKRTAVVLLDDINAELDKSAISRLLQGLKRCDSQLFITSLDAEITHTIADLWQEKAAFFQVNAGKITTFH